MQIASRIFGPGKGPSIATLCTATIRAVAQGVVGIAFIQMLLVGVGFVLMGVPGAGLLALAVLLLGIMQMPATLITVPVIVFVFATRGSTSATIVFAIYVFVAGLVDNVLKPLLLGRGVDVPMPVVLIGALGGMVTGGIIGLFIGPVMLAVGYQLFWQWVEEQPTAISTEAPEQPDASTRGHGQPRSDAMPAKEIARVAQSADRPARDPALPGAAGDLRRQVPALLRAHHRGAGAAHRNGGTCDVVDRDAVDADRQLRPDHHLGRACSCCSVEFDDFSTALYHSGVNFVTLGYGDIVMSERWRLLGPLEGANGILMFGVSTAVMTAAVMDVIKFNMQQHGETGLGSNSSP